MDGGGPAAGASAARDGPIGPAAGTSPAATRNATRAQDDNCVRRTMALLRLEVARDADVGAEGRPPPGRVAATPNPAPCGRRVTVAAARAYPRATTRFKRIPRVFPAGSSGRGRPDSRAAVQCPPVAETQEPRP